jgi:hypothetical protein
VPIRRTDPDTAAATSDISLRDQSYSRQFRKIPDYATLESFQDIDLAREFLLA